MRTHLLRLLEYLGTRAPFNNPNGEGREEFEENNISWAHDSPTVDDDGSRFGDLSFGGGFVSVEALVVELFDLLQYRQSLISHLPQVSSPLSKMSLVANEDFQHILRVLNTNVDGKQKIMFALTSIKGIGRRFANIVCKKADIDMNKSHFEVKSQVSALDGRWKLPSFSTVEVEGISGRVVTHVDKARVVKRTLLSETFWFKPREGDVLVITFLVIIMAGELTAQELDNLMTIVANPRQFKIPDWFLNRQKDYKDGKYSQVVSNALDMKLRDDLERLKKIRNHRGLRHYWGLRVRGQHTKTTGRRGKTVGVSKKR
ncbi:hypothetical protein CXB51_011060 [Gossypium anomalum]|uniref:40S ribosomal protein S18 n=1 Tax=Gossypium anomalum TaxID=47600 RepID=A0A8J6D4R8_9ROSI|nr:hypothetical protein CXB51_011060 [Gossypium anomalum]